MEVKEVAEVQEVQEKKQVEIHRAKEISSENKKNGGISGDFNAGDAASLVVEITGKCV